MKKLNATLVVLFLMLISVSTYAQLGLSSGKTYGGSENDFAFDMATTPDGGYIIAGHSESIDGDLTANNGLLDLWLVKTNTDGDIEWQKNYGGSDNEYCRSVGLTSDGGYILAGTTSSVDGDITDNSGAKDAWIVRVNSTGDIVWQQTFGGTENDEVFAVMQTSDEGFIAAGYSKSAAGGDIESNNGNEDVWIIKMDADGNLTWTRNYGGTYNEELYALTEVADGYIVVGDTKSNDIDIVGNHNDGGSSFADFLVMRLDTDGNLVWQKCYGGFKDDDAKAIIENTAGNFIVAGSEKSSDGDVTGHYGDPNRYDYWVIEIDPDGTLLNQKNFGGTKDDQAYSVTEDADGNYLVAGQSGSSDIDVTGHHGASNTDYWVAQMDASFTLLANISLGGSDDDVAQKIITLEPGYYATVGFSKSFDGDVLDHHGAEGNQDFWLAVLGPCSFTIDEGPFDVTTCEGTDVTLTVEVTGSASTYTWIFVGGPSIVTAGPNLVLTDVTTLYSHNYYVIASGACGADTSEVVTLLVNAFPTPDVSPAGPVDICATGSVELSTTLTGADYMYQWYKDGTLISGAEAMTYTATAAGTYFVNVSNPDGCSKPSAGVIVTSAGPAATVTLDGAANICASGAVTISTVTGTGYSYQWYKDGLIIAGATSSSYTATEVGSYYVILSVTGCASTSTSATTVVTNEGPGASIVAGGNLDICLTGSVALNSTTPGSGLAYQWLFNGAPLSGAVGVSILAVDTGLYNLQVTNLTGCKDTSEALKVYNSCTAIQTPEAFAGITISPNPSNGNFLVSLDHVTAAGDLLLEVLNMNGEKVYSTAFRSSENMSLTLPLSYLPAGNYMLKLTNTEGVMMRRLMINH